MIRRETMLAAGLFVFIVFSGWITNRANQLDVGAGGKGNASPLIGRAAPDFTLQTLGGQQVKLSDFRTKKKVVVAFWASWCPPCRMEMPLLQSFYQKNHDKNVEVLAVSIDEDPGKARSYAEQNKLAFPVLIDTSQRTASGYHVEGIPVLFVVDKTGKVEFSEEGLNPALEAVLTAAVNGREAGLVIPKGK